MTWETREEPILQAIRQVEEEEGRYVSDRGELADLTGLNDQTVALGLQALLDEGYIAGSDISTPKSGPGAALLEIRLLAPGRRASGQWPPEETVAALRRAIEIQLDQTDDEEERQTLTRFRQFLQDANSLASIVKVLARVAAISG